MKYDCSKTLDYVHERERMCKSFYKKEFVTSPCCKCPLHGHFCYDVTSLSDENIDIVQKWSDEHPEKTRKEAFFELFPKCVHSTTTICFYMLIGENKCCGKKLTSCDECWNEPYEGEFEKAREEDD